MPQIFPPPTLIDASVADLNTACYQFALQFSYPKVEAENIFIGWQNYFSLPSKTNDFIVITVGNQKRIGTNCQQYENKAARLLVWTEWQADLDFYVSGANDNKGRERALGLCSLLRDETATLLFEKYGARVGYADDPVSTPFRDEHNNWVPAWRVTGYGYFWSQVTVEPDWIEDLTLQTKPIL